MYDIDLKSHRLLLGYLVATVAPPKLRRDSMYISVVAVLHQILLLEALQAAVVGTEFQIISSPFKEHLALEEFTTSLPFYY